MFDRKPWYSRASFCTVPGNRYYECNKALNGKQRSKEETEHEKSENVSIEYLGVKDKVK